MIVVRGQFGVFTTPAGLTCGARLGPAHLFVLAARLLLLLGHLLHVEKCVPTEHTENGEDRPFDRVEVTQRVPLSGSPDLPPCGVCADRDPQHERQMQTHGPWGEILRLHGDILTSRTFRQTPRHRIVLVPMTQKPGFSWHHLNLWQFGVTPNALLLLASLFYVMGAR